MDWEANVVLEDHRIESPFEIVCSSGIGARESQQDTAFSYVDDKQVFAVVCDGMGGASGGALASQTAVEAMMKHFNRSLETEGAFVDGWSRVLEQVDDDIYSLKDETGARLGAGTTLAAVYMTENQLRWLSVGDSHIYVARGNEFVQVTIDHNYYLSLNQQRNRGTISESKYQEESQKGEALISFVGMGGLLLIDENEEGFALAPGDKVLICSDGVYRTIGDKYLQEIICSHSSVGEAGRLCTELIERLQNPYQDNYTLILIGKK